MKRTQVYLEKDQDLILRRLAEERSTTVAELIREAIDRTYLKKMPLDVFLAKLDESFGAWKREETGAEYVDRIRQGERLNRRIDELRKHG